MVIFTIFQSSFLTYSATGLSTSTAYSPLSKLFQKRNGSASNACRTSTVESRQPQLHQDHRNNNSPERIHKRHLDQQHRQLPNAELLLVNMRLPTVRDHSQFRRQLTILRLGKENAMTSYCTAFHSSVQGLLY